MNASLGPNINKFETNGDFNDLSGFACNLDADKCGNCFPNVCAVSIAGAFLSSFAGKILLPYMNTW
tara:strand:+ start:287 stop:484 length:198 start_codon:yes stop_codon:yes gene_type:complete